MVAGAWWTSAGGTTFGTREMTVYVDNLRFWCAVVVALGLFWVFVIAVIHILA